MEAEELSEPLRLRQRLRHLCGQCTEAPHIPLQQLPHILQMLHLKRGEGHRPKVVALTEEGVRDDAEEDQRHVPRVDDPHFRRLTNQSFHVISVRADDAELLRIK